MAHTTSAAMIRTVVLLALITASSANRPWKGGFSDTFPKFTSKPRTATKATKAGWVEVQGPTTSTGYDDLTMMIKSSDCTTGLFYDGDYLAGYMVALAKKTTKLCYDATAQGLISWTCSADGAEYLASLFFFVSEDNSTRTYDEDDVVQAEYLTFLSNNGTMDYMPKNLTTIKNDDTSVWKKQSCMIMMGHHYYRSMTSTTTCDIPFCPYFGLYDYNTNQLIGVGFMVVGSCVEDSCEHPSTTVVKTIVSNGPQCLYDKVDECSACTRHIYFVDFPLLINCF